MHAVIVYSWAQSCKYVQCSLYTDIRCIDIHRTSSCIWVWFQWASHSFYVLNPFALESILFCFRKLSVTIRHLKKVCKLQSRVWITYGLFMKGNQKGTKNCTKASSEFNTRFNGWTEDLASVAVQKVEC